MIPTGERRTTFVGSAPTVTVGIVDHVVAMEDRKEIRNEEEDSEWDAMMDSAWKRVMEKGKTLRSWDSIPGGKSLRLPSWRAPEEQEQEVQEQPADEEEKSELLGFLKALNLEDYASLLIENGFYIDRLRTASEKDLKMLGLPLGPRRKICETIAKDPSWSGFEVK